MLPSRFEIPRTLIGREAQLKEASGDRSRVVVADYHPLWRQALSGLLREQLGLEVVAEAADGREAVDCCRQPTSMITASGPRWRQVDDLTTIRTIKREFPDKDVLVLSACADPGVLVNALKAGASGYILKTSTPQQIIDAVRSMEGGHP